MKYALMLAAALTVFAFGAQADDACSLDAAAAPAAMDCCAGKDAAMELTKSESEACKAPSAAALMSKTDAPAETTEVAKIDAAACHMEDMAKTDSTACSMEAMAKEADAAACHMSEAAKMTSADSAGQAMAKTDGADVAAAADACTSKSEEACASEIAGAVPDATETEVAAAAAACSTEKAEMQMTKSELPECCAAKMAQAEVETPSGD